MESLSDLWGWIRQVIAALERGEWRLILEVLAFSFILWRLRASRKALEVIVRGMEQTLRKRLDAVEDAAEANQSGEPQSANWEQLRAVWREARDRLELKIDQDVDDGRKLRKYSRLSRRTYRPIIRALEDDRLLSNQASLALQAMNQRFLSLRRARTATPQNVQEFQTNFDRAKNELPKLPKEAEEPAD